LFVQIGRIESGSGRERILVLITGSVVIIGIVVIGIVTESIEIGKVGEIRGIGEFLVVFVAVISFSFSGQTSGMIVVIPGKDGIVSAMAAFRVL
jgi:hypothetical protein